MLRGMIDHLSARNFLGGQLTIKNVDWPETLKDTKVKRKKRIGTEFQLGRTTIGQPQIESLTKRGKRLKNAMKQHNPDIVGLLQTVRNSARMDYY